MKEKNTLRHKGFIVFLYFSGMLTFYLFCRDMHKQIGRVPVKAMIVFMILLLCVFSAVNYLVSRKKNRNLSSIFANMIIPEGVYIVYLYRKCFFIKVLCIMALFLTMLPILLYVFQKNPVRMSDGKKKILKHRVKKSFFFARRNFTYILLIIIVISFIYGAMPVKGEKKENASKITIKIESYEKLPLKSCSLKSMKGKFKNAMQKWDIYSETEKEEVLEKVIEVEATNLGLGYSVHLSIRDLDDICYGRYRDFEIQLQRKHFQNDSFLEQVKTLSHEMYHSFQGKEIDLYEKKTRQAGNLFDKSFYYSEERGKIAEKWKEEFDNYISGTDAETIEQYYFQDIEISARAYSERRYQKYLEILDN